MIGCKFIGPSSARNQLVKMLNSFNFHRTVHNTRHMFRLSIRICTFLPVWAKTTRRYWIRYGKQVQIIVENDNDDDGDKAIPKHTQIIQWLSEIILTGCSGAGCLTVKQKLSANNLKWNQLIYIPWITYVQLQWCWSHSHWFSNFGTAISVGFWESAWSASAAHGHPLHWSHGNLRAAAQCVTPRFVQKVWKTSPQAVTKSDTSNVHSLNAFHLITSIELGGDLCDFGGRFSDHGSANPPLGLP